MRILILANSDIGLYKFRKELIKKLIGLGHHVIICLPNGEYIPDLVEMGCEFQECALLDRHGTNPIKEISLIKFYKEILKKMQPQLVLTYTIKPNIYGGIVCAHLKIPFIMNITGLGSAVENSGFLQLILLNLYKVVLKKARKVFFQNEDNKNFVLRKCGKIKAFDILPGSGVNLNEYELLEYPSSPINFVFVARIMKEKGIDQYLEAAKYIKHKYSYTNFHICGFCEEEYTDRLKKLEEEGIIIYHGSVRNMKEIYQHTSCTVHPTYYPEGLSNVLLESAACGRPIITTNRPGCREVIENGVNGYVIREQDAEDLIEKIEKFLQLSWEERKKMGIQGRLKVEREFDRNIVINKYLNEVRKVQEELDIGL